MKKLFQQVFVTTVALTVVSYSTAIVLACQDQPNTQQVQLIEALTFTAKNGSNTIFGLLGVEFLRALLLPSE
ncbi:MAG: hypothetical protein F6K09_03460 [Merismopedia sp. SIO2A8]|nr:hypothetical protein [Merismopedia sp. SIO2A8]